LIDIQLTIPGDLGLAKVQ